MKVVGFVLALIWAVFLLNPVKSLAEDICERLQNGSPKAEIFEIKLGRSVEKIPYRTKKLNEGITFSGESGKSSVYKIDDPGQPFLGGIFVKTESCRGRDLISEIKLSLPSRDFGRISIVKWRDKVFRSAEYENGPHFKSITGNTFIEIFFRKNGSEKDEEGREFISERCVFLSKNAATGPCEFISRWLYISAEK